MDARTVEIWKLVEPLATECGCELADVEFAGSGARQILRIFLDRPGAEKGHGVTVEDCAEVSRRLGDVLDAYDAVRGGYMLEVSTPGFERPLRRARDFRRFVGQSVKVRLRGTRDGRRNFAGQLVEVVGESGVDTPRGIDGAVEVGIEGGSGVIRFRLDEIEKARLVVPPPGGAAPKGRKKKGPKTLDSSQSS